MPERSPFLHLIARIRHGGMPWLATALRTRLWPTLSSLTPAAVNATRDRIGLEIGGPSRVFTRRAMLPVYPRAARIDNVNFASGTAWESGLREGGDFIFDPRKPPGRQFLREASSLEGIPDSAYDFVLSSHCLEHVANPLAALQEWRRVTREGGYLLLILPDPKGTFDHRRPITSLAHLRADFAHGMDEDDLTHLPEILALHDLTRDPLAGSAEEFRIRSLHNAQNRCLHHHVFDLKLINDILQEAGWEAEGLEQVPPMHLVALARKRKNV